MTRVGFIGLGHMGGPMAANLVKAGYDVYGMDVVEQARQDAAAAGVKVVDRIREAVEHAALVITMLPTGGHVREVVLGDEGVLAHAGPNTVIIDCSTVDVETTNALHEQVSTLGHQFVDAPVSGGVAKARAGTLTFMVGAEPDTFTSCVDVLEAMGANIVHVGPGGSGTTAKICNNMLFGATLVATAEAFALARSLGLDEKSLYDIVTTSSGDNWGVRNFCPVPGVVEGSAADEGYAPRFAAALMKKDLGLAVAAGAHAGVDLLVSARADEVFARLVEEAAGLDASAVIRVIGTGKTTAPSS